MHALVIGASPDRPSTALIRLLAEEADLVVGVDGGADIAEEAGIGLDLFVGDLDSVASDPSESLRRSGTECMVSPQDKDESDLHLALNACLIRGCASVAVTGVSGGRLDHELAALGTIADHATLKPQIWSDSQTAWILSAQARDSLLLTGIGATVSVIALSAEAIVSVSGVRWPLVTHALRPLSDLGLSNLITEDDARIVVSEGTVAVIAEGPLDARAHEAS